MSRKAIDQFVEFVGNHPACVLVAGPRLSEAARKVGFDVKSSAFASDGVLTAINLPPMLVMPEPDFVHRPEPLWHTWPDFGRKPT